MKRFSKAQIFLVIVLIVLLVYPLGCKKKESEAKEIKIGAILPLTGSAAIWGTNVKNGLDLAVKKINSLGGVKERTISILYEDSGGQPKEAVAALNKLIATHDVPVVIGDVASSCVLAMAPVVERKKIVLLSPGASNPKITDAGEFVFRNWHSDNAEGEFLAKAAYKILGMRNVGILYVNNAYGKGLEDVFINCFKQLGGNVSSSQGFEQSDTDFRTQLTQLKNDKCDGIFLPGYPREIPEVLKQAKELGVESRFLCPSAFEDQQTLDLAGIAAEGVIYVYPRQGDLGKSHVAQFYKEYEKLYGKSPGALSDTGYDALFLIVEAMKRKGTTSSKIRDGLLELTDFPGVSGDMTFDGHGDIIKEFVLKTVVNGRFDEYDTRR